jgi:amidophosphoribosyltransferase
VCEVLGADGLVYQDVSDLIETGRALNPGIAEFDAACFTGRYVTGDVDEDYLAALESSGRGANRRSGVKVELTGAGAGAAAA